MSDSLPHRPRANPGRDVFLGRSCPGTHVRTNRAGRFVGVDAGARRTEAGAGTSSPADVILHAGRRSSRRVKLPDPSRHTWRRGSTQLRPAGCLEEAQSGSLTDHVSETPARAQSENAIGTTIEREGIVRRRSLTVGQTTRIDSLLLHESRAARSLLRAVGWSSESRPRSASPLVTLSTVTARRRRPRPSWPPTRGGGGARGADRDLPGALFFPVHPLQHAGYGSQPPPAGPSSAGSRSEGRRAHAGALIPAPSSGSRQSGTVSFSQDSRRRQEEILQALGVTLSSRSGDATDSDAETVELGYQYTVIGGPTRTNRARSLPSTYTRAAARKRRADFRSVGRACRRTRLAAVSPSISYASRRKQASASA
jgi:hypothetical protein